MHHHVRFMRLLPSSRRGSINRHLHFAEEENCTERAKGRVQIKIPAPGSPPLALLSVLPLLPM